MRPNVSFFSDWDTNIQESRIKEQKEACLQWLHKYKQSSMSSFCKLRRRSIKKNIKKNKNSDDNTNNNNNEKKTQLILFEIGCGNSLHSLRWEAFYIAKTYENVCLFLYLGCVCVCVVVCLMFFCFVFFIFFSKKTNPMTEH